MNNSTLLIHGAQPARTTAPVRDSRTTAADDLAPQIAESGAQHELCEAWSIWCKTRNFYGPPPISTGILGKLSGKSRPAKPGAGDGVCSAELMALHKAITAQVDENGQVPLARRVFELHYRWRVKPIKAAAHALGISESHWHRLRKKFTARVCAGSAHILREEMAAAAELGHAKKPDPAAESD